MRNRWIVACAALGLGLLAAQAVFAASPFAASMNNVCRVANAKIADLGVSQSLSELTANVPRLLAADKWKLARLAKLGRAPTGVAAPFATYLSDQRQIDGLETRMVASAKHVQLSTVLKLQTETDLLRKKQDTAAHKIGAAACLSTSA